LTSPPSSNRVYGFSAHNFPMFFTTHVRHGLTPMAEKAGIIMAASERTVCADEGIPGISVAQFRFPENDRQGQRNSQKTSAI